MKSFHKVLFVALLLSLFLKHTISTTYPYEDSTVRTVDCANVDGEWSVWGKIGECNSKTEQKYSRTCYERENPGRVINGNWEENVQTFENMFCSCNIPIEECLNKSLTTPLLSKLRNQEDEVEKEETTSPSGIAFEALSTFSYQTLIATNLAATADDASVEVRTVDGKRNNTSDDNNRNNTTISGNKHSMQFDSLTLAIILGGTGLLCVALLITVIFVYNGKRRRRKSTEETGHENVFEVQQEEDDASSSDHKKSNNDESTIVFNVLYAPARNCKVENQYELEGAFTDPSSS